MLLPYVLLAAGLALLFVLPALADSPDTCSVKPFIDGGVRFAGGMVVPHAGAVEPVTSPIVDEASQQRTVIGNMAQMTAEDAIEVLEEARRAWDGGQGEWPQMSAQQRISALQEALAAVRARREEIVQALVWEICKSLEDAAAEFDRTMAFVEATIAAFRAMDAAGAVRRSYPFPSLA